MVYGWIDNYIANTRKLIPLLDTGFGEWTKKNHPNIQKLESFKMIRTEFSALIRKNLDFKIGGRTRMNDPIKFSSIWNTWEQVISQRTTLIENEAIANKDIRMIALAHCLTLVTKTVHDEIKDEKKLDKVLANMMTDLYKEIKKIIKK